MLSESEVRSLEDWAGLATLWGEASQRFVGASGDLANTSRDVADQFDNGVFVRSQDRNTRESLARQLRQLATAIEDDAQDMRNSYLDTAAGLEQLRSLGH